MVNFLQAEYVGQMREPLPYVIIITASNLYFYYSKITKSREQDPFRFQITTSI